MNNSYKDIIERISDPPLWWDERAVPRWCEFHPSEIADIYASEAVLLLIECQYCEREFSVCMSTGMEQAIQQSLKHMGHSIYMYVWGSHRTLAQRITEKTIHYGDPPNAACCASGPSANSEPQRVLQYWKRDGIFWTRDDTLEIDVSERP